MDAETLQRDRLREAFAQRRGGAGVRVRELAGERFQALDRGLVVGELPGRAQPALDRGPVAFGQVIEDVAFLVTDAALDGDVAEDGVNGGSEGLAAVQDDEDALVAVQAAVDEVREQLDADALVLRRAVPQPQRDLDAIGRDAERDDAAAALQLEAVEHQRRQANVLERTGHQRAQMLTGAPDELAADRALRRRTLRVDDVLADRLTRR